MNLSLIKQRAQVVKLVRQFFDDQGFLEMHTPRLVGLPGQEPYLEPMWTTVTEQRGAENVKHQAALITSPEYAMKRLLAAGLDKIYDLGPCFRDGEPWDGTHDPEFLLLEWYRRDAGLEELMRDTEEMIRYVMSHVGAGLASALGSDGSDVGSEWADARPAPTRMMTIQTPFRRLTVAEAMKQYANVDLDPLLENREAMATVVREHGQTVTSTDTWDDLFFKIFLSEVEPKLGWSVTPPAGGGARGGGSQFLPTFLWNYPASMAALARRNPNDSRYALRTELYIGDYELANGFAELADEDEQRKRFLEEQELRRSLGKKTWPLDERFLKALPKMGNAAGIAFGVERLVMLLAGVKSISYLMPIPVKERFQD
jgi:lysyl-tRNA synthetase class 2